MTRAACPECEDFDTCPLGDDCPVADEVESARTPRYPVKVRLTGTDGNAFAVLGRVSQALRKHGVSAAEVKAFNDEAMSGNYDQLLQTCCRWVEVS